MVPFTGGRILRQRLADCNLRARRFIPQGVNLRTKLLFSGLLAISFSAPGCFAQDAGTNGAALGAPSGAASTRTHGARSRAAHPRSAASSTGEKAGAGAQPSNGNQQSPAPAENSAIEVTGRTSKNQAGSMDRPLLPVLTSGNGLGIPSGTPIQVRLRSAIDSGHVRNGDTIDAMLAAPLAGLAAGTPVQLTVVQSAPAGRLYSYGELSIQVVSIGQHRVLSDVITALGKEGAKEIQDAAPARGTEATFTADQVVQLPAA